MIGLEDFPNYKLREKNSKFKDMNNFFYFTSLPNMCSDILNIKSS